MRSRPPALPPVRPRGVKVEQRVSGGRKGRTSIIAACNQDNKLIVPFAFEGTCNAEVVDTYFSRFLLSELELGTVIVLDNARFNQSPNTRNLVE